MESSSWVIVGMAASSSFFSDVTTARGYATISSSASSTLGDGRDTSNGANSVIGTLGCAASSAIALVSPFLFRFWVCCSSTLGSGGGSTACTSTSLFLSAAFLKIVSSRPRAWMSSSHMSFGLYLRRVSDIRFAAEMIASAGVTDGLVMYLCLKNTVSDTLVDFVFIFHRFQHR